MAGTGQRYVEIKRRLWAEIQAGRFGRRLPPEPQLAKDYGVSRMTLRRAITELVSEGFLTARPGAGTFITEERTAKHASRTIGMVLDPYLAPDDDPYFGSLFGALAMRLAGQGYRLIYAASADQLVPTAPSLDDRSLMQPVEGVIAVAFDLESVGLLRDVRAPLVLAEGIPLEGRSCLLVDNQAGIHAAVDHLVAQGHRRIAHVSGGHSTNSGGERIAAWRDALLGHGLEAGDRLLCSGVFTLESGHAAANWYRDLDGERPTAVVCANDRMALGLIQGLAAQGLQVPRDLSVIGFDDIEAAMLANPPLSSVAVDRVAYAERLCALLLEDITADRETVQGRVERFPVQLIERATTAGPG